MQEETLTFQLFGVAALGNHVHCHGQQHCMYDVDGRNESIVPSAAVISVYINKSKKSDEQENHVLFRDFVSMFLLCI